MDFHERNIYVTKLMEAHQKDVYRILQAKTRYSPLLQDLIHESVQDTFKLAAERYESIKDHPEIARWLTKVAIYNLNNAIKKQRRRLRHEVRTEGNPPAPIIDSVEEWHIREEREQILGLIFDFLSETDYHTLLEIHSGESTIKEIARRKGVTISAVKMWHSRIKRKLSKMLKDAGVYLLFFLLSL